MPLTGGTRLGAYEIIAPLGELFFVSRARIMAVTLQLLSGFSAGNQFMLFDAPSIFLDARFSGNATNRTYDIARDGQRFLMMKQDAGASAGSASPAGMIVVQNWFEVLKTRMSGGK